MNILIKEYKINLQESDIVKQIKDFIEKNPTQKDQINEFYNKALSQQKENTSFHNLTSKIHKNYTYKQNSRYFIDYPVKFR